MFRSPADLREDMLIWVEFLIKENPGIWTAKLCRLVNGMEENEKSVMYCGRCVDYANPRKRERARKHDVPTLPGFEPQYQLHGRCPVGFHQLIGMLNFLCDECVQIKRRSGVVIPDARNYRGWDYATRWWPM